MLNQLLLHRASKPLVFVLCLLPMAWLVFLAATDQLGANPAEALIRSLGDWALRFLCISLAVTPLRLTFQWTALARYRRMLGLYVFFYASMHWLAYGTFDMGWQWGDIVADVIKRPFILVGTLAWLALLAMAITSPQRVLRAMGGKRWQALHRVVYAVVALAVLHFFWMRAGKNNFNEVAVYGAILLALLLWRVVLSWRKKKLAAQKMAKAKMASSA